MSADEAKEVEEMGDIDGPMVDYKSKGNQVELLGKEKMEGTDAFKLKVNLRTGTYRRSISMRIPTSKSKRKPAHRCVEDEQVVESAIGDYKGVNGIIFPLRSSRE